MYPILVADIGGTHARFGLSWGKDPDTKVYNIGDQKVYRCAEYPSLTDVIRQYFSEVNEPAVK
jgi:glucokinase